MPEFTMGVGCIILSAGPYLKDPAFFLSLLWHFAVLFCGVSYLFLHSRRVGCDIWRALGHSSDPEHWVNPVD